MDVLLKAVADLKINPKTKDRPLTEEEKEAEKEFTEFKKNLFLDIREKKREIHEKLHQLKEHHINTLKHNVMVARDTVYIAEKLGLSEDRIIALRVAALLHDVGKLDLHEAILDLGDFKEMKAIWEKAHPNKPLPKGNLITMITVKDVVEYKASRADDPQEYIASFKEWLVEKGLTSFLNKSIREYLNHHQPATRRILEEIGVNPKVVDYAAGHHPSYFGRKERNKLPKECRIIEMADKFNAIIQSEGVRHYFSAKARVEALDIIAQELKREFGGLFKGFLFRRFEKRALKVLIKKYLPQEVKEELIPQAEKLIEHLRNNLELLKTSQDKEELKKAERLVALITVTLTLSKEFRGLLDSSLTHTLEYDEYELKHLLGKES